jgi:hypothetical protein
MNQIPRAGRAHSAFGKSGAAPGWPGTSSIELAPGFPPSHEIRGLPSGARAGGCLEASELKAIRDNAC